MNKKLFTVFGHPIAHSLSPKIHKAFAKQFEIELSYTKTNVEGSFEQALKDFMEAGGQGANVTVPLKTQAYDLCREVSPAAHQAKAVNTLVRRQDHWYGTNTDGRGFVQDIVHNLEQTIEYKKILILGAGGAVRGMLGPILNERPNAVWVANRTLKTAEALCHDFAMPNLRATEFSQVTQHAPYDIVINATSITEEFNGYDIDTQIFKEALVYDLMYSLEDETPFIKWAKQFNPQELVDGLGMLVEQAALSFEIWFDCIPMTDEVLHQLRNNSK